MSNETRDFVIKSELLKLSDNLSNPSVLTKPQMEFKLIIAKNFIDKMLLHYGINKFDIAIDDESEDA